MLIVTTLTCDQCNVCLKSRPFLNIHPTSHVAYGTGEKFLHTSADQFGYLFICNFNELKS